MEQLIHPDMEKILISREQIQQRVADLGAQISRDYAGKTPTLVGVLRGCVLFLSDLMQHISIDCRLDFICPSSYAGTKSTGVVRLLLDLREPIEGKDVIIVEDIVDSGLTMSYLLENFKTRRPKSLSVCTLLDKTECRTKEVPISYAGFKVGDEFVVGYGLDYWEIYRNLPYIGVLKSSRIRE
ncbi:MAG: hypoxanthine phosphoribosyltransferase [Elusimicrobiaceae bacterium]|nr:hypoxanthine phosphoribosyltransferase [Elusimicrobiaceae bacterium]